MAKIVIAGSSDCPRYARVELLADNLAKNLPDFKLHKIVKTPSEWKSWLDQQCNEKGWRHSNSPIIWRELVNRGGKGVLIGGANEFQEYAKAYYDIESCLMSSDMLAVAKNNASYKEEIDAENELLRSQIQPMRVCITNASQQVAYQVVPLIAKGDVFGEKRDLSIVLYDKNLSECSESMQGLVMEIEDLAENLVRNVTVTDDLNAALQDCAVVLLTDDLQAEEEEPKDSLLKRYEELFREYGKAIDEVCLPQTKVVVCGSGPVNFCTSMLLLQYTRIQKYNTVALGRKIERQVKSALAQHMAVNSAGVINTIVWGNPTGSFHVDLSRCLVREYDGAIVGPKDFTQKTTEVIWDKKWLKTEFPKIVAERSGNITSTLGHASGLATAHAITDFLRQWWHSSDVNEVYSLGVASSGLYNVPEDLVFSFPVTLHPKGYWSIVEDMEMTDELLDKITEAVRDLRSEWEVIFPPPKPPTPDRADSPTTVFTEEADSENDLDDTRKALLESIKPKLENEFPDAIDSLLAKLGRLEVYELQLLASEDEEETLKSRCVAFLNEPSDVSDIEGGDTEASATNAGRELGKIVEEADQEDARPQTQPAPTLERDADDEEPAAAEVTVEAAEELTEPAAETENAEE